MESKMSHQFKVYASMSDPAMHYETPSNAAQFTVIAEDVFEAMGKANIAGKRCGIDIKAMKYFEVKELHND